jgi:hypothetical protein
MSNNLVKMGKLVHDNDFSLRVAAAMFIYAKDEALSKNTSNSREFAIWVLKNPMVIENSLLTLIASDKLILDTITLDDSGEINLDLLNDEILMKSLKNNWNIAAVKFPPSQTNNTDGIISVNNDNPPVGKFVGKDLPGNPFLNEDNLPIPSSS